VAPKVTPKGKNGGRKLNGKTKTAATSTAASKQTPNTKAKVENPKPEKSLKAENLSPVETSSSAKEETAPQGVRTPVAIAIPVEPRTVETSKLPIVPTSVYEDDEANDLTKEDCACACVIS